MFCKICTTLNVTPDYLLLGEMHPNDLPANITDRLRLCSERDLSIVRTMVDQMTKYPSSDDY